MKKNIILLVLAGVVLFAFILGTSYAWYQLFDKEVEMTASLEIKIHDRGQGVVLTDALPINDKEGKQLEAYKFEVKNNGKVVGNYKLIIEEAPFNKIKDGCTSSTLLNRDQLRYQLLMNDEELVVGNLDDIKNNIIDFRTIKPKKENKYELRVWVKESAYKTDWDDKHYHYSIGVVPVSIWEED